MSFAIKDITRLLAPQESLVGAVVGIDGALVRVATVRGAVMARSLEANRALAVGERVQVKGGMATRAPVATLVFAV